MNIATLRVIFDGDASGAQRASDTASKAFDATAKASGKATDSLNRDQARAASIIKTAMQRATVPTQVFGVSARQMLTGFGRGMVSAVDAVKGFGGQVTKQVGSARSVLDSAKAGIGAFTAPLGQFASNVKETFTSVTAPIRSFADTTSGVFTRVRRVFRQSVDDFSDAQLAALGYTRDVKGGLHDLNGHFVNHSEFLREHGSRAFRIFGLSAESYLGRAVGSFARFGRGAVAGAASATGALTSMALGVGDMAAKASAALGSAASATSQFGSDLTSIGRTITGKVLSPLSSLYDGLKKVTVIGAALTAGGALLGGFQRLDSIDQAQAKLRGLGHDAASVQSIMDSALASVKGTAYGLGDAAALSATAVAAGIKPGQDLTRYLKIVADTATIAGASIGEIGSILNKTTTSGRVYTMKLNQLADRGLPVFTWLQEAYGVSAEKLREMVAAGEIDAGRFAEILEENIGGAAMQSGETFRGGLANVRAALGRLGAAALEPLFDSSKQVFPSIIAMVDRLTDRVGPLVEQFLESKFAADLWAGLGRVVGWVGDQMSRVWDWAQKLDWDAIFGTAGDIIRGAVVEPLKAVWGVLAEIAPKALEVAGTVREHLAAAFERIGADRLMQIVQGVVLVGAAIGPVLMVVGKLVSGFGLVLAVGSKLAGVVAALLSPVGLVALAVAGLAAAGLWLYDNFEPFTELVDTIVGKVTGFVSTLQELGVEGVVQAIGDKFAWLSDAVAGPLDDIGGHLGRLGDAGSSVLDSLGSIAGSAADAVRRNSDKGKTAFSSFSKSVTGGVSHITNALGSIGDTVSRVFSAVAGWFEENEETVDKWAGVVGSIFTRVGEVVGLAMEAIKEVVELALGALQLAWDIFGDDILGAVVGAFDGVLGAIDGVLQAIGGVFDLFIGIFTGDWSRAWDGIKAIFGGVWDAIYGIVSGALDLIWGVIKGALDLVWRLVQGGWDLVLGLFRWYWGLILGVVSGAVEGVVGFVRSIPEKLGGFVGTIFDGVKNAMTSAKDWVIEKIEDILDFVRELPGKVTRAARGVWDGIKDAFGSMLTKLVEAWNKLDAFTVPDIPGVPRHGERFDLIPDFPMPKFHDGGVFTTGTGPQREGPAVLQNGEGVFTPEQMRALGLRASRSDSATVTFAPVIHADRGTDVEELRRMLEQEWRKLIREMKALGVVPAGV